MQTILVTGAAGFIGSHLCERLLSQGYKVIGLDNFDPFYDRAVKEANLDLVKKKSSFEFIEADLVDRESLFCSLRSKSIDVVIHLAAKAGVRPSIEDPQAYFQTNVNGTLNLLDYMVEAGIKQHLFSSSSSVYGNNKKVPFSETDNVDRAISPYAASKKAAEVLCHVYAHLYGIHTACVRFFTVYGPRQRPDLAIHKFTKLISSGQPIEMFGDGSMQRDYTYIDDIIDGVVKIQDWLLKDMDSAKYEIFNLGESRPVDLKTLIVTIENALGQKADIVAKPMQPGDVNVTFADVSKAKEVVGYNPQTTIEDGVCRFILWYRSFRL